LGSRAIDEDDRSFVAERLMESELRLFDKMSPPDQRHAVAVALAVRDALGQRLTDLDEKHRAIIVVAALLHDVGKNEAGLGSYGRVIATLSARVAGDDLADVWKQSSGFTRRVGLYLGYPALGADMLRIAESHPWVIAWAGEHHEPPEAWSIPLEVGELLVECDDC